ncbi:MAG: radical SAM protein [Anaerolineaceae bacterium]|nr:radical SAM protein [Anaerolineaceae bacterium]
MKIREIQAKILLSKAKEEDPYFGILYTMNLYRGCSHRCIYCDSRSECYQIEDFDGEVLVKTNAIELLARELSSKRQKGRIGTGSMNDPYQAVERKYELTRQALKIIARRHFPVHIITKGDLVTRDVGILQDINREQALVSFTLTTVDDDLARKVEPFSPVPSRRLAAMRVLADAGIRVGVTMMPILPFIEDNPDNIKAILYATKEAGAEYILPWMGMSCRNRQREYYYAELDKHFPGLSGRYQRRYGNSYEVPSPNAEYLYNVMNEVMRELELAHHIPAYEPRVDAEQPSLFG